MKNIFNNFETHFGYSIPKALEDLYSDKNITTKIPGTFKFKTVGFVLEIRELLDIKNVENYDVENGRLSFAVNSDGFKLLVDLNSKNMEILQDEFDDIDSIGVTIQDLLDAEKVN
ncbi:hypothetical protein TDB9533_04761 [Thalassocella blandensis]|nr:hypothetical protein TDB9533_04761 [Thalassocella blandensis]